MNELTEGDCWIGMTQTSSHGFILATRVGKHTDQFIAELIANTEGTTNGVLSGFLGMSEQNATASRIEEYARRWFIRVTKWCSECRVR